MYRLLRLLSLTLLTGIVLAVSSPTNAQDTSLVTIHSPQDRFTVSLSDVDIVASIQFDAETMDFWKVEVKHLRSRRAFITGPDGIRIPLADNWVTLSTGREAVNNAVVATLPGWPDIYRITGYSYRIRIVVVAPDGTFVEEPTELAFRVRPDSELINEPASISTPTSGASVNAGDPVTGTVQLNFSHSGYVVQVRPVNAVHWQEIANVSSDPSNPVVIRDDVLATIPTDLPSNCYDLRIIVLDTAGVIAADPATSTFQLGPRCDSLIDINNTFVRGRSGNIVLFPSGSGTLFGNVILPPEAAFYKIDIKDEVDLPTRDYPDQEPLFTDWTTIGEVQTESSTDGTLTTFEGNIPPGVYQLRVVVVDAEGRFLALEQIKVWITCPARGNFC
jgi:hypothetical protein